MPEVGYCRNCRWWQELDAASDRFGMPEEYRECGLRHQQEYAVDLPGVRVAYTGMHTVAVSNTYTAPDFGCVQFTQKEAD